MAFDGSEPPSSSVATYDYFEIREIPPAQCVTPPSGLASWWKAEGNANDNSGTNHGTLTNGATFASGQVGQAFSLDGTDDYVSIPDASNLDFLPTAPLTAEAWVFRTGTAPVMHILGKRVGCGPSGINYQMAFDPASGYPAGNAVDGNTGSHWRSGNLSSSTRAWWRVDLGAAYNINNVVINWRTSFYAKKYKIQTSLTGSSWATVHTDNAGNGGIDNVTFTAVAARYVRIRMNQNNNTTECINEVQVFAAPGALAKNVIESEVDGSEVAESDDLRITDYVLEPNYPNPFNPSTVISFQLPENSEVKLTIYSVTGQVVHELVNGGMNAGRHAISWDGRDRAGNAVAAGMYLYRLVALNENGEIVFTQTRRMAFVK